MSEYFDCKIFNVHETLYEGAALSATFSITGGDVTLLKDHTPFFACAEEGVLNCNTSEGKKDISYTSANVQFVDNKLLFFVEQE